MIRRYLRTYPKTSHRYSYLVRLIKPNLITSHDWHVQPNCQRSLRVIRLSGPLGSRPGLASGTSSNLMRPALISFGLYKPGPFLREPFKTIEVRVSGQVIILIPVRFPRINPKESNRGAAQNLKDQTAHKAPEPLGLTGA
jgi:hypothetical protein